MTAPSDPSSDVRVDWRVAFATAGALVLLFTFQNYVTPRLTRGSTLPVTFALQLIVWGLWLALCPLIFAIARRWRRTGRFTAGVVVKQLLIGFGVSTLHAALAGTLRWMTGLSVFEDLERLPASSPADSARRALGRAHRLRPLRRHRLDRRRRGLRAPVRRQGNAPAPRDARADLERRLPAARFIRIHRSFIVQSDRIDSVQPWFKGDYVITLRDGTRLQSGRTSRQRVQELLR